MQNLGKHLIVEFYNCNRDKLNDKIFIERMMHPAVDISGATIIKSKFHRFKPMGVSGTIIIAESHASIHTWPEYGYAAFDYFTCGKIDIWKTFTIIRNEIESKNYSIMELKRGLFDIKDELKYKL